MIASWQAVAGCYEAAWRGLTPQFGASLLSAAGVERGDRVLDLACGPGFMAHLALERGAIASGVDASSAMIAIARARVTAASFCVGDAERLPFRSGVFDCVVSNFGVPHFANLGHALAEMQRVLRPGGKLSFTTWCESSLCPGARMISSALDRYGDTGPRSSHTGTVAAGDQQTCMDEALKRAGFGGASIVRQIVSVNWMVPSASFVLESERHAGVRTAAVLRRQSSEANAAIARAVTRAMAAFRTSEGYAIPYSAYVVSARTASWPQSKGHQRGSQTLGSWTE